MENLGIDVKLIISQALNFAVFFFIFTKYIAKPFYAYIAKQKELEKEREELAVSTKKQQEDLIAEQEKIKEEMKKELDKALKKAKEEGAIAREEAISKARKEAEDIVKKAHEQIEHEREEMAREMKNRVAEISSLMVTKGLREYMDEKTRKDITKFILEKVSKEGIGV